jgi:hypothetical protein
MMNTCTCDLLIVDHEPHAFVQNLWRSMVMLEQELLVMACKQLIAYFWKI